MIEEKNYLDQNDYYFNQNNHKETLSHSSIDNIRKIVKKIQNEKPHLNPISILCIKIYKSIWDNRTSFTKVEEIGITVFDSQKMTHKFLFVQIINEKNISFTINKDLISKYNQFQNTLCIPEVEKIKQIVIKQDILLYDIFIVSDLDTYDNSVQGCFVVYETEQLDMPYDYFLDQIDEENKLILQEYMNKLQYHLMQRCGNQEKLKLLENYYIKLTDEGEIQIKSFVNAIQCIQIHGQQKKQLKPLSGYVITNYRHLHFKQVERIFNNTELNLQQQLKQLLSKIQQTKIRIQKQNLSMSVDVLVPQLMQNNNHSKEIFQIISQHPKYNIFTLIGFNECSIIFKIKGENQKFLLKLQKFNSLNEANHKKEQYESLRKFQNENEGFFLNIGECEVICVEQGWYVSFEEFLTIKQKNTKLIPFQQIYRIQKKIQQMNISKAYIFIYLIFQHLKQFEKLINFGFKFQELIGCQPYLKMYDNNKISSNQVIFSNPYFLQDKYNLDSNIEEEKFMNVCQYIQKDYDKYQFVNNLKHNLTSYINYQINSNYINLLDKLNNSFSKIRYILKQIENFISLKEQFPTLSDNDCYFSKNFKIIQILNVDNLTQRKDIRSKIVQFEFQKFICTFEQLPICQQYLSNNNIQYLQIKDDASKEQKNQIDLIENVQKESKQKKKRKNVRSFFEKVQKLSMKLTIKSCMNIQFNQYQFPSLQEIKIELREENENKLDNDIFKKVSLVKSILEIFKSIKTFQKININIDEYLKFKKYQFLYIYSDKKNELNFDYMKELSKIEVDINSLYQIHNISDIDRSKVIEVQIQKQLELFKCLGCESKIQTIKINEKEETILLLKFYDTSELNLGEIEVSLKLNLYNGKLNADQPLKIDIHKCKDYFYCKKKIRQVLQKWIKRQMRTNFYKQLLDKTFYSTYSYLYCINERIYSNQLNIKSIKINIYDKDIYYACECLSQSYRQNSLQELHINFYRQYDEYVEQFKYLFSILKDNQSINTIHIQYSKIPLYMLKLKRVVKFVGIYENHVEQD